MEQFWIWLCLGIALICAELISGTFVILFFGIGGILTSVLPWVGVNHIAIQVAFFALSSTLLLLVFRKRFIKKPTKLEKEKALSADIGTSFTLSESLPGKGESLVAYQGTHWTAVNTGAMTLEKGTLVVIERTEGIKLFVRRASPMNS